MTSLPLDLKSDPGLCDCEFTPYDPADYEPGEEIEESWHYLRECPTCGRRWWGLHCPHDGVQNPCPECGLYPATVPGEVG